MKFKTLILLALTLMASTAQAQSIWTFEQVLASALASHPTMLGKRSAQDAARAEREGAEWGRYPTFSAEASTQNRSANTGQLGGSNAGLRLEQPLWTGGRITANIDAAGSRLDAAGAALEETRLDLSLKVIAAYTEALRQKARQQHAATGLQEHEKLLGMIRRRVAQEVSSLTDQRLAEARLYQAANDLSLATQGLNNALAQLSALTGKPVAQTSAQGVSEMGAVGVPVGLEAALMQARDWSPVIRRLAYEEEAANAEIALKRSAYMPQLALRLQRNVGQANDSSVMLVLTAQPGAGLSAASGVDAAIAKREAARMAREGAERDVRERVTLDWNEWVAVRLRLENANQSRAMSTEVFESYARQYVIGRKTWIDVLNAVREATQSQLALEDTQTQTLAASLRLRAQIGALGLEK
jgi:adhesin transport system outer membrane protein